MELLNVSLFSINGKLIKRKNFENISLIPFEINEPSAIYILEIANKKGEKATLRLFKK
jgi:hypothetical protein